MTLPCSKSSVGEKSRCPISLVVVRHGAATSLFQRQAGLGAIQRLNLTLLIDTQDDRLVWRIQVEPDDVGEFFDKLRVT